MYSGILFIGLLMKPSFCLGIPFPVIQRKDPGSDKLQDEQGIPDVLPSWREDEEYQDRDRYKENDDIQFHRKAGMYGFEAVLHMVRLPEGQTAATGGDNEFFHNDPWLVNAVLF